MLLNLTLAAWMCEPCSWLAFPGSAWFGSPADSTFSGWLGAEESSSGWSRSAGEPVFFFAGMVLAFMQSMSVGKNLPSA